jgi:predicted DNA-binding ribbon-helix-helix protein
MTRPLKRSLMLRGHATSVTLEDEFWNAFKTLADRQSMTLNGLAAAIDDARSAEGATGLATAIRLAVLSDLQARLAAADEVSGSA